MTRPMMFTEGRVNAQYILEGLASGVITVLGSIGYIVLDRAYQGKTPFGLFIRCKRFGSDHLQYGR